MVDDAVPPVQVPPELADLLQRPLVGYLATTRPDGGVQCNPMWFSYDGTVIEMSHTSNRKKFRNLAKDPRLSFCIADPENLYRYIEVRGRLESTRPDEGAAFHRALRVRYGMDPTHVPDADVRVVLAIRPTWIGGRHLADQSVQR